MNGTKKNKIQLILQNSLKQEPLKLYIYDYLKRKINVFKNARLP